VIARAALALLGFGVGFSVGCGPLPPVESSFDPSGSDPAAVALLDDMIEAAGGAAAWSEVRELGWLQGLVLDGALVEVRELVWDRALHRHRHVQISPAGAVTVVMAPLDKATGSAYRVLPSGCPVQFLDAQRARVLVDSAETMREAAFWLAMPFSLRAGGIRLELAAERVEPTVLVRNDEPTRYQVLRVTRQRDSEVFDLVVDKTTRRPVLVERTRSDGVLEGTRLDGWRPIGDIQLATRRRDVGSTRGATLTPLEIPARWRDRVALAPVLVPARGTTVIIAAPSAQPDVDPSLFVPHVATR
jgi:hypothetical protein